MKLKRLIIQGFKSFKDRTTIEFDDGITGIVGPNGCGKSNIVDALFWVMGEQSAKHLRGNTMKDIIFAGSAKSGPGTWAEASLVLENTEGKHIHIGPKVVDPSEIQLTRKLYRNGETEYRINGTPARLKDIQEVFMDTGAGAKSYSIIAQGEINRLVQAKPEERRAMIEEVAGVTKFKLRRKESLKKIDQTQDNLARLSDLQTEIEKNLRSLQHQAEKAEKARSLKEKIERNELVVSSHKVFDLLKELRDGAISINEKRIELESSQLEKQNIEVGLEEERHRRDELTSSIEDRQSIINELSRELAGKEERLKFTKKMIEEKSSLELRLKKEAEELDQDIAERTSKLEELQKKKDELSSLEGEDFDTSELEERVELLQDDLEMKKEAYDTLCEELAEQKKNEGIYDQELFKATTRIKELSQSLEETALEMESLETQFSGSNDEVTGQRKQVEELRQEIDTVTAQLLSKQEKFEEVETGYQSQKNLLETKRGELVGTESKLISLIEINQEIEEGKEGIKSFIESEYGPDVKLFGKGLRVQAEFERSAQCLLAPFLDLPVITAKSMDQLAPWHQENPEKYLKSFFSTNREELGAEALERLAISLGVNPSAITPLHDIIDDWGECEELKESLKALFIIDGIGPEQFKTMNKELPVMGICSKEGDFTAHNFQGHWAFELGNSASEGSGVLARNNLISSLESLSLELREQNNELEEGLSHNKELLDGLKLEVRKLEEHKQEIQLKHASLKSGLDEKSKSLGQGQTRVEILRKRKTENSQEKLLLLEKEEEIHSKLQASRDEIEDLQERVEEVKDSLDDLTSQFQEHKDELSQKQIEAKTYEQRLEGTLSQMEDITKQIERFEMKQEQGSERSKELGLEIEELEAEGLELFDGNIAQKQEVEEKEESLSIFKDQLAALLIDMHDREQKAKNLGKSITKLEREVVEFDVKSEKYISDEAEITRDIFERFQTDLRRSVGVFLEYTEEDYTSLVDLSGMYFQETENGVQEIFAKPYQFTRRYGQDLKECGQKLKQFKTDYSRLGEINWQAIKDYERQKKRFDFLKEQEEELKASLEDLENAVAHIDEKSKQRFKIAFEEVDERFKKVFPIIFGGGEAFLRLVGDFEEPNAGIDIVARPPGKKMQNINLMSGGEKAMTAVSLIFSIFLVKPSPFCLLDEVDAPLDDANVGRFNDLLREMSEESQFILITHNKKTMELNDTLYGVTMQEPGISKAVSVQLH